MTYLLFFLLLVLQSCVSSVKYKVSTKENSLMAMQTRHFLQQLPADLQQKQALAIEQALRGDYEALKRVREARNQEPVFPASLEVQMLTPTLRFYVDRKVKKKKLPLLIYLHGGGWTFGSLNSCATFCQAMALSRKCKVLAVDYRLAPENPYPAGLNDCIEALSFAYNNAEYLRIDSTRIALGGDSSGGNLAIATALKMGKSRIDKLLLFYPVIKAFNDGTNAWNTYAKGYGLDAQIMEMFNQAYTHNGSNRKDSYISVGLSEKKRLAELPQTLLIAAGKDILFDQGKEFAQMVGDNLTYISFPEASHLFITVKGQPLAFKKAVDFSVFFLASPTIN